MEKYGTVSRIRLLQYNARGDATRPEASLREKTWNLASTKVPEVIESFRASSKRRGGSILGVIQRQVRECKVWLDGALNSYSPARVSTRGKSATVQNGFSPRAELTRVRLLRQIARGSAWMGWKERVQHAHNGRERTYVLQTTGTGACRLQWFGSGSSSTSKSIAGYGDPKS